MPPCTHCPSPARALALASAPPLVEPSSPAAGSPTGMGRNTPALDASDRSSSSLLCVMLGRLPPLVLVLPPPPHRGGGGDWGAEDGAKATKSSE